MGQKREEESQKPEKTKEKREGERLNILFIIGFSPLFFFIKKTE